MSKKNFNLNRRKFLGQTAAIAAVGMGSSGLVLGESLSDGIPRKPKSKYLKYKDKLDQCFSAVLQDVMDGMNFRLQCMDPSIRALDPGMRTWGEAMTIYLETATGMPEKPFQVEMDLLDSANEGHIMVAQCNSHVSAAIWGGLLTNAAVGRKMPGVIIDGAARDYHEIMELNFPVFCKELSPYDSLGRLDGKESDVPIECGGVRVNPGDLVFGDIDGVVVVPQEIVDEVVEKAWEKIQAEGTVRDELRSGAGLAETFKKYGIL